MTEKRFLIDDAGELIDLNNHQFIDYGDEVCNLLNELAEENEQLKQLIKKTLETTPIEHTLAIELKNSVRELYD